jgi:hypothetical protein
VTHQINDRIDRLELHDSKVLTKTRIGDKLTFEFDWAKLTDFKEKGLGLIITGKSRLNLEHVISEKFFEVKERGITMEIDCPVDFLSNLDTIGENESKTNQIIRIDCFYKTSPEYRWIRWVIEFERFEFSWDNFVTQEDWQNGKVIE